MEALLYEGLAGVALFFFMLARTHRRDGVDVEGVARTLLLVSPALMIAGASLLPLFTAGLDSKGININVDVNLNGTVYSKPGSVGGGKAEWRGSPVEVKVDAVDYFLLLLEPVLVGLLPYASYRLGAGLTLAIAIPRPILWLKSLAGSKGVTLEEALLEARIAVLEERVKALERGEAYENIEPLVVIRPLDGLEENS